MGQNFLDRQLRESCMCGVGPLSPLHGAMVTFLWKHEDRAHCVSWGIFNADTRGLPGAVELSESAGLQVCGGHQAHGVVGNECRRTQGQPLGPCTSVRAEVGNGDGEWRSGLHSETEGSLSVQPRG